MPNPPWVTLVRAIAVVSLGVLAVLVAIVLGSLRVEGRGTLLDGEWPARVEGREDVQKVGLPFNYDSLDLDPDQVVQVQLPLTLRRELPQPALLVEDVHHHLAVRWDGQLLATVGSMEPARPTPRRDRIVVSIPPELAAVGDHLLELDVRGDHGSGGIFGSVRMGTRADLDRLAGGRSFENLALSAMLCMASVLGLVMASVRPKLAEFLWFGLFCAAAATVAFATDDAWWLASNRLDLKLRMGAAGYALLPGAGLLFVHELLSPERRTWTAVVMNAGFVVALFALLWPDTSVLPVVTGVIDLVSLVALGLVVWILQEALRNDVEGAPAVALAVAMLGGSALAEKAASLLGQPELRILLPAFLLFVGTAAAALVLRSTDLADRYRQLVATARDAILVVLADGTIEEVNATAERMLSGDPVGERLWARVLPEDREIAYDHVISAASGLRRAELRILGEGGRVVPVESVATDVREGRVMLVMRDMSARRKVEEGMLHAARMETVGIIAGGIAHDFNNTMTALMAHIGLLRLKVEADADKQRLTRMEAVIRRAAHMTRRLLTMARGGDKERHTLNIAEPVHSAVELTRSMLPRNITIKERIESGLPMVLGSADDLEQGVLNLLVNARDALAPTGGTIRVRVRIHREEGLPAGVRIEVIDDGPGVPESVRASIWEPFFTTKGEGRGTGLGLSVVARVIREHGGRIDLVDQVPGRDPERPGARFHIILPGAEDAPLDTLDSVPGRPRRILVVEDEEEIREMIRQELATRGYLTTAAPSAEAALHIFARAEEPFDALVTDVVMSGMDGIRMAYTMVDRQPDLRVVIVSGFIPEHAEALAPDWQSVAKPFQIEQLATAVRRALVQGEDRALITTNPPER